MAFCILVVPRVNWDWNCPQHIPIRYSQSEVDAMQARIVENWEFADNGLMMRRFVSINDVPIQESERKFR